MAAQTTLLLLSLSYCTRGGYAPAAVQDDAAYVTFESRRIANHSYVDGSLLHQTAVVCHSPLHTCCSAAQGPDRGDWINPRGQPLKFSSVPGEGEYQVRLPQLVELRCVTREDCASVSGLYRCEAAVRDSARRHVRQSIYVGLYADASGGSLSIPDAPTISSTEGDSPHFSISCISIGGPATTVTWTRDSLSLADHAPYSSRLVDQSEARYEHTLSLTQPVEGLYTCSVSNDKPSTASAQLRVKAPPPPSIVGVSQRGRGTLKVEWVGPRGDVDITGYIISHRRSGKDEVVSVAIGATETSFVITGLMPGATYSLSLRATSRTLLSQPSEAVEVTLRHLSEDEEKRVKVGPQRRSLLWVWLLVGVAILCLWRWGGAVRRQGTMLARERCSIS